jgi:hypothetical protein
MTDKYNTYCQSWKGGYTMKDIIEMALTAIFLAIGVIGLAMLGAIIGG